jgi:hypothetical protein
MNAQKTIVEEKCEKGDVLLYHQFLPESNLFVIQKGKEAKGLYSIQSVKNATAYEVNGNKKVLFQDMKVASSKFSLDEKALLIWDISSGLFSPKAKILIDDKYIELSKPGQDEILKKKAFFTSKNVYNIKNNKDEVDINLEKNEDLFLHVIDIFTNKKESYKIQKPNLARLIGPNFIEPKEDIGFALNYNRDETFDFITKSISKDYTNTILYKTRLSNQGKITNELIYDLKIPQKVFLYSRNGGGKYTYAGEKQYIHFGDDLSVNNYIEDTKNGDFYIYGLYGDAFAKLNTMANPKGFYIFKFDKSGNKIWESINEIKDTEFRRNKVMIYVEIDLVQLNNMLCFTVGAYTPSSHFNSYSFVDIISGKTIKSQNLELDGNNAGLNGIPYRFKIKDFNNKTFDFYSAVSLNSNPKFAEYVKNVKSKSDINFQSYYADKGVWLCEKHDNDYFKVTFFEE